MATIVELDGVAPTIGEGVFLAPTAVLIGDVRVGDRANIWFGAVLRGDSSHIRIGDECSIQDNAVLHVAEELECRIGAWVTVGHSAILHACQIGDECLVGMGAVILDGAEIGTQCLIGARALVTQQTRIPEGSLVLGSPAKVVRALSAEERAELKHWANKYVENAAFCLAHKISS